jgi:exosortase D (VPLPA-CTERM-specific)
VTVSSLFVRRGAADWSRGQAVMAALMVVLLALLFRKPIVDLVSVWLNSPEYNYGPIVPVIAILMIWRDLQQSDAALREGRQSAGWSGVVLAGLGFASGLIGYLHKTEFIGQLGLFLVVIGGMISILGERQARAVWPGLLFPLFALPLATVVQFDLTWAMQLVATQGGVALIRMFDIPVFREGNIIDLGEFKLQVAEACSGLRYLFPLACFSFLCAYLFRGSAILRAIVFISAVPITVLMNIVRIAITGVLVNWVGLEAAQGFFHDFEGWAVFCLCLALLFLEMKLICLADGRGRSLLGRLDLTFPTMAIPAGLGRNKPIAAATVVLLGAVTLGGALLLDARDTTPLARASFSTFPAQIGDWQSTEVPLDDTTIQVLNATDYLSRNYGQNATLPVNLFVSYYASERTGTAVHSPQVCIPGAGWEIEQLSEIPNPYPGIGALAPERIKRLIIRRGAERQLVYYWFVIGGKPMLNEYLAKFREFENTLTLNRSDEGLIRLVMPIGQADTAAADRQLLDFVKIVVPTLDGYFPPAR